MCLHSKTYAVSFTSDSPIKNYTRLPDTNAIKRYRDAQKKGRACQRKACASAVFGCASAMQMESEQTMKDMLLLIRSAGHSWGVTATTTHVAFF